MVLRRKRAAKSGSSNSDRHSAGRTATSGPGAASARIIKRYSNRKLYDTEARRYVTLEEVAKLIRGGADVRVQDNDTGEDLTSVTLSQILLEQERQHRSPLPKAFLTNVFQSGARIKDALLEKGGQILGPKLDATLDRLHIPTRAEFEALQKAVADLTKMVERLEREQSSGK